MNPTSQTLIMEYLEHSRDYIARKDGKKYSASQREFIESNYDSNNSRTTIFCRGDCMVCERRIL